MQYVDALKLVLKGTEFLEKQNNQNKILSENLTVLLGLKYLRLAKKVTIHLVFFKSHWEFNQKSTGHK